MTRDARAGPLEPQHRAVGVTGSGRASAPAVASPSTRAGTPTGTGVSRVSFDREAMASYVLSRRTSEGGYCFYRTPAWGVEEPNAPDTLAALESLGLLGIEPPEPGATGDYLRSLQEADGGFPTLTIGWAVLRCLCTLSLQPRAEPHRWLASVWAALLARSPQGEDARRWPAAIKDALRLVEARRAAGTEIGMDGRGRLAELLDAAGDPEGGWARHAADLETTGVAIRLIRLGGLSLASLGRAGELLDRCEDPVLGLRIAPDAAASSGGAVWGGLVTARALGLALRYPAAISRGLVLLQRPDGGLGARHRAISTLADTWRGLEAAALFDQMLLDQRQEEPP